MIRRVVLLMALVAMSGLLVFGGIHRTQSVLASEGGKGSESIQLQNGSGGGRSLHGAGAGEDGVIPAGANGG